MNTQADGFLKSILISSEPLDLMALQSEVHQNAGESGAVVTFTGAVRVSNEEQGLVGMSLEHYPGMTEIQLARILEEANKRWQLNRLIVAHRVGYLTAGEPIVFVGACGLHRKEAFEAAEFVMDYLKQKATFWKKEHYADREVWVEAKASDQIAAKRWFV